MKRTKLFIHPKIVLRIIFSLALLATPERSDAQQLDHSQVKANTAVVREIDRRRYKGLSGKDWKDFKTDLLQDFNYSAITLAPGVTNDPKFGQSFDEVFKHSALSLNAFISTGNIIRRINSRKRAQKVVDSLVNANYRLFTRDSVFAREYQKNRCRLRDYRHPRNWRFDFGPYYGAIIDSNTVEYYQLGIFVRANISALGAFYFGYGRLLSPKLIFNNSLNVSTAVEPFVFTIGFDFVGLAKLVNEQYKTDYR